MAQKITSWLLITLLLSLGFGQLLRFDVFGATMYLHDLLVILVLLLNVGSLCKKSSWNYPGIKFIFLGLGIGWLVALLTYPLSSLLLPALYLARLVSYLCLFLVLNHVKLKISHQYFVFAGLVTLIIGLLQYFLLPDMRVFQYMGWDDHLNRLILPHFDPTYTGIMLVLFLFILTAKQQVLMLATVIATCLTYSRSVLMSFAAAQILMLHNIFYLLLVLIFTIYIAFIRPHGFGEGTNLLRTYSIESRLGRDVSVIKSTGWKLITGTGYNTFATTDLSAKGYPNHAVGPNSSFLHLLSTSGILGLLGWLIFLKKLGQSKSMKASIFFVVIASLFNNVLLYPFVLVWILLLNFMVPSEV